MIAVAAALYLLHPAILAFDYRESPPAALFPFQRAVAGSPMPDAVSNPAYLPLFRYPYFHASGSMPYSLDGLYSSVIRTGYGGRGFGIQASWSRFGIDAYMEHVAGADVGYMPLKYLSIGVGARYYHLKMDMKETGARARMADGRASILLVPIEWIELAFQQENIGSLFVKKRRDLLFPGWSAGVALKPIRGLTLAYNLNLTSHGYVNSLSATAAVLKYFTIEAGYARETMTSSASLSIIYRHVSASYGLRYHPHLGLTHSVGVILSTGEIPVEPINYGRVFRGFRGREKTIDLRECTLDQLRGIPWLSHDHSARIIRYRDTVGPLTRTGLARIGMTERDIDRLLARATGLAPEERARHNDYHARIRIEDAQKRLFRALIGAGLSPGTALELAEMAVRGEERRVRERIRSLPGLDAEKMKAVAALCAGPF